MKRACGILLPVASLPSEYGIGAFSKEAYAFVDQLAAAGQRYWQILPLGPTGYGDSPYQSFSAFAGNPYFIDLETLVAKGLLTKAECDAADLGADSQDIDYEKQYFHRFPLLKKAFGAWKKQQQEKGRSEKSCRNFLRMLLQRTPGNIAFTWRLRIILAGRAFFCGMRISVPEGRKRWSGTGRAARMRSSFIEFCV